MAHNAKKASKNYFFTSVLKRGRLSIQLKISEDCFTGRLFKIQMTADQQQI